MSQAVPWEQVTSWARRLDSSQGHMSPRGSYGLLTWCEQGFYFFNLIFGHTVQLAPDQGLNLGNGSESAKS